MKYFLGELWKADNMGDPDYAEECEKKWIELTKNYTQYFNSIKNKLPKQFIKTYIQEKHFHDFIINSISIAHIGKNKLEIIFDIIKSDKIYRLKYKDVKGYNIVVPENYNWFFGKMSWGYDEFEFNKGIWTNRILCDFDCEIEIKFKKVSVEKIKD